MGTINIAFTMRIQVYDRMISLVVIFFVTLLFQCCAIPLKAGSRTNLDYEKLSTTFQGGAGTEDLSKNSSLSYSGVSSADATNETQIRRFMDTFSGATNSASNKTNVNPYLKRKKVDTIHPVYVSYLEDQVVGKTRASWIRGIMQRVSHVAYKFSKFLQSEHPSLRRFIRVGLDVDLMQHFRSFHIRKSNNHGLKEEKEALSNSIRNPNKQISPADVHKERSNHSRTPDHKSYASLEANRSSNAKLGVRVYEHLKETPAIHSASANHTIGDENQQHNSPAPKQRRRHHRLGSLTTEDPNAVTRVSGNFSNVPHRIIAQDMKQGVESGLLGKIFTNIGYRGSPGNNKKSESVSADPDTGLTTETQPEIHPMDDEKVQQDGHLSRLSLAVYKTVKSERAKSIAATPCRNTISWLPAVLNRLETEVSGLQFYCIETDVFEKEMEHVKRAFDGLSSLRYGGFITARSEDIEAVMPRNLDMIVSSFGIREWGARRALGFVKGLQRSGVRTALFTGVCTPSPRESEKHKAIANNSAQYLGIIPLDYVSQRKSDECERILVYSLNSHRDRN